MEINNFKRFEKDIEERVAPVLKNADELIKETEKELGTNRNIFKIFIILLAGLLVILTLNLFLVSTINFGLKEKVNLIKEANKPVKVQISAIKCKDCYDITPVVESIKTKNVEITNENTLDYGSEEAKNLIQKYGIKTLPSVLIFGEINNVSFNNFELVDDALILRESKAPYLDLTKNKINGRVSIIEIVDSSCKECISLSPVSDTLGKAGVSISNWKKVEYNSAEGIDTINKFGIKKVPSLLISNDINYYEDVKQLLVQLNLVEKQGFYSLHPTVPPYRDLTKNSIVGLVDLIMLVDDSCKECYNIEINKQILLRFGVKIKSEKTYDINSKEGKQLISNYNIQKVPIIIVSPEAEEYEALVSAWKSVGTIENDKWFVMRAPEIIGTSKIIKTGELIIKQENKQENK